LLLDRAGSTDLRSFSRPASKRRVGHSGNRKRRKRFPNAETLSVGESTIKKEKKKRKKKEKREKEKPVASLRFSAVITAFA